MGRQLVSRPVWSLVRFYTSDQTGRETSCRPTGQCHHTIECLNINEDQGSDILSIYYLYSILYSDHIFSILEKTLRVLKIQHFDIFPVSEFHVYK